MAANQPSHLEEQPPTRTSMHPLLHVDVMPQLRLHVLPWHAAKGLRTQRATCISSPCLHVTEDQAPAAAKQACPFRPLKEAHLGSAHHLQGRLRGRDVEEAPHDVEASEGHVAAARLQQGRSHMLGQVIPSS